MSRVALGSYWHGDNPPALHLLLDIVLDLAAGIDDIVTCRECGATWDRDEGTECRWCAGRRNADAAFLLKTPTPRGHGYATAEDLAALGIDPVAERTRDLRRWAEDLEMAADAGLVTEQEARAAWGSRTN